MPLAYEVLSTKGEHLRVLVGGAEQPLPGTEQQREHQQVETVDEARIAEAAGEGGAGVDL